MAELNPIEKMKIIEDDFQKWFRKAYELKDSTDIDINSLVSNLPKARLQRRDAVPRTLYFKEQFKSTIKIPPQFQDRPKAFLNLLGKYFLDSSKFLYKEQIRYEYSGFVSSSPGDHCNISIYKTCGNEIGSVDVKFRLEGNLVVSEVGYQIFDQVIPLLSHPNQLLTFSSKALGKSGRRKLCSYFPRILMMITEENYWKYSPRVIWPFFVALYLFLFAALYRTAPESNIFYFFPKIAWTGSLCFFFRIEFPGSCPCSNIDANGFYPLFFLRPMAKALAT